MLYEFPWNDFKNEKIIVTVRNQFEYKSFLELCVKEGIDWVDGVAIEPQSDSVNYDSIHENSFVCHIGLMSGDWKEIYSQLPLANTQIIAFSFFNFE